MENNWKEYINYILDGDATLFIGAGFSIDNKNLRNEALPLTSSLNEELQIKCDIKPVDLTLNIQSTSQYFIKQYGEVKLIKFLREKFTVSKILEWQKIIANVNWRRIYTTNYDNVFEIASNTVNKHSYPIDIAKQEQKDIIKSSNEIIHLNGYIDFFTPENLYSSTKLTSQSYLDINFLESSWRTEIDFDFEQSKAIFFIGFSLDYDLDLKRIISSNNINKEKIFFINGPDLNEIKINALEEFGTVILITAEEFANILVERKDKYIPLNNKKVQTFSFIEENYTLTKESIKNEDLSDLFFFGKINDDKLYSNYQNSNYIINRTVSKDVINALETYKVIFVQSKLGNGKSIFLKHIECYLKNNKKRVFTYNGNSHNISDDISILEQIDDIIYLIIDDYYSIPRQLKYLSKLNLKNIKFIISGRTDVTVNTYNTFLSKTTIAEDEVYNVNLDFISSEELEDIYNLVSNHNLWGTRAADSKTSKIRFIKKNSELGYASLILELVKSNNILEKIDSIYSNLPTETENFILLLLINNLLRTHLNIRQIQTLTKSEYFSKKITDNFNLKEFSDINNNKIFIKSGIPSQRILKQEKNKQKIINLMRDVLIRADKIDSNYTFDYLKRSLVSFSNIKLVLSGVDNNTRNKLAVEYFENIKNSKFANKNPFFWLQYGIQTLEQKKYELADNYFDTALSFATKKGYDDFYQINAQKARGIMESIIAKNLKATDTYSYFIKVHSLLVRDLEKKSNRKDYQLGQGRLYENYYLKYYKALDHPEKIDFRNKINTYIEYLRQYVYESTKNNSKLGDNIKQSYKSVKRVYSSIND